MKKIGIIIPDFAEGGMPKIASTLIEYLQAYFTIDLILLNRDKEIRYPTSSANLIRVTSLGTNFFSKIIVYFNRIYIVRRIVKNNQYNAVIGFGVAANILAILCRKHTRVIGTEHNIKSIENKKWGIAGKIFNVLMRHLYPKADLIVAISEGMKVDLIENYGLPKEKIIVINNPHNLEKIKQNGNYNGAKNKLDNGVINFVTIGRLTDVKNQLLQIRAVQMLSKNNKVNLHIFGEGVLEKDLKNYVGEQRLEETVHFHGFVKNPYPYLKEADAFLLTSLNEGFPNALIESLCLDTPVITADCVSGPREIVDPAESIDYKDMIDSFTIKNNGILTKRLTRTYESGELNDSELDFYNALVYFLENKTMISEISESVNRFDSNIIGEEYKKQINRIC